MIKVWRLEMETQALPHTRDPEFATATARGTNKQRGREKVMERKREQLKKVKAKALLQSGTCIPLHHST